MFKFVVLCAVIAAAIAEPQVALTSVPLGYPTAGVAAPLATSYIAPASSVYQPHAVAYSSPFGFPHFIKKRSAPLAYSSYIAPSTYVSSAPFATTYSSPYWPSVPYSPVAYTSAHLIKKRAAVFPSTYFASAPYAAPAPYVASTYSAGPVYSTPYVSAAPVYSPHFIKKRSAQVAVSSFVAPTSYSSQTRFDYSAPSVHSYTAAAPVAYASPFVAPAHVF